jgi:myosin-5
MLQLIAGVVAISGGDVTEVKHPANLFQQQLGALVQWIFPKIRDNIRKEITPILVSLTLSATAQ